MDTVQQAVITLLRSAVTGEKLELPQDFDLELTKPYARKHNILPLIYEGANNCGITPGMGSWLFSGYCKSLQISEGQLAELNRIFAAFEEEKIDYMPLKGSKMKYIYPKPELRTMGDADVLIRLEQYEKIIPIMESLGFVAIDETDHELIWQKSTLDLELHKRLIPSYNKDYAGYFGDGWTRAKLQSGSRYTMSPEDEWIYELTHFAKHLRDGGIGCRHVLDLWLYRKNHPELDQDLVEQELKKLNLADFDRNVRRLTAYWFEDGPVEETVALMSDFILASGSWGLAGNRARSLAVRNGQNAAPGVNGRVIYLLHKLFPPAKTLRDKYKVLQKAPWLLPVVWLIRPFYKILFERASVEEEKRILKAVDQDSVEFHHQMLQQMGLDYRF